MPGYVHIDQEVDSNDALNIFISTFPQWRQHLRPEASKSFFVVTDDDATDAPNDSAAAFRQAVTGLDPVLFAEWTRVRSPGDAHRRDFGLEGLV